MFVSPPPASTTGQAISKRQPGTSRHGVSNGLLQSIPEGDSSVSFVGSNGSSQSLEGATNLELGVSDQVIAKVFYLIMLHHTSLAYFHNLQRSSHIPRLIVHYYHLRQR